MKAIRCVAAAVIVAALHSTPAAPAAAGTYVVEACRTEQGAAPASAWTAQALPPGTTTWRRLLTDECQRGGLIRFELGPLISRDVLATRWAFEAPPGTSIVALDLWRYAEVFDAERLTHFRVMAD